jgi:S-(hydroxymethyl)glutathione dehydrogenase/alcohol dehydrogenase
VRAAVLHEVGQPLEIRDLELEAPRVDEVRLRIAASGICRSDLSNTDGTLRTPLPVVLGHEAAGVVVETGDGVKEIAAGDRVVVALSPECGECLFCREGRPNLCLQMVPGMIGSTLPDGSTRLRLGDAVPPEIPLERACLLGCGVITGAGAALNTPEVCAGAGVAVIGCGGVGLSAIQGARIAGAGPIIAIDVDPGKLALARELGATHAVDAHEDVRKAVRKITGLGVHVAIEAIGRVETIQTAWEILRPAGLALVIGMPRAGEGIPIRAGGFFQEKRIAGCVYGNSHPHRDIERLLSLAGSGELLLDPMVSEEISLAQAQTALDALARGEGTRRVIVLEY